MHKSLFRTKELTPSEELKMKNYFNIEMSPREWMARYGHNILLGDSRIFKYQDKTFEAWIHKAFKALRSEGLEKLWKEFLTDEEIIVVREKFNHP